MREIDLEKSMPASREAEQLILGCVLLSNELLTEAAAILKPEDFFVWSNRRIYQAMLSASAEGRAIDPTTIQELLARAGDLERCGGPVYLASLFDGVPRFSNIENYCRLVAEKATARRLIHIASQIEARAFDQADPVNDQVADAQKAILEIQDPSANSEWLALSEISADYLAMVEDLQASGRSINGLSTGFSDLDYLTGGLQKGDLIIFGGRPSMGKTGFAVCLAEGAAKSPLNQRITEEGMIIKPTIAIFSMEMSRQQLAGRFLSSASRVDNHRLRTGGLAREDWSRLMGALKELEELGIFIDDQCGWTVNGMRSRLRQLQRRHKAIDLIVVDYLQLMTTGQTGNAALDYGEVAKGLKSLAKEFNAPLLAISSLSRNCEQRVDKRPLMSDLRESGAIEFHADMVMFVYRDVVYNPNTPNQNIAEMIIRKQRNGPVGTMELVFLGQLARFEDKYIGR